MKSMMAALVFALIGCASAPADESDRADMEFKAERALQGLLSAKHSPRGGVQCWAGKVKRNLGVSDGALLDAIIAFTKRDKVLPYFGHDSNQAANPFDAIRAARDGLILYPGNPRLESVILEEFRRDDMAHPSYGSWMVLAAGYGSVELIQEVRGLVSDSRFLASFDREVERRPRPRFARNRFPEGMRFENWVEQRTQIGFRPQATALLMLYLITVMLVVVVFRRNWPHAKMFGAVAIAAGIAFAALWTWVRGMRWSSHDDYGNFMLIKFDADPPDKHLHHQSSSQSGSAGLSWHYAWFQRGRVGSPNEKTGGPLRGRRFDGFGECGRDAHAP